ncbi:hypothetical protein FOZ76_24380 [Verticiella sediminum]|uniref:Carboxypeptidase regulatory-like domain-containing protein n=1 Tax=Verticiella sediminum TaxID=1247510 RepID=A0A556A7C3_9BURK|nr:hypothetical protein [Verticiella sediminum]TSH88785.1 hypothetical protein FOZ76_24380 [Verticiella sediminum]
MKAQVLKTVAGAGVLCVAAAAQAQGAAVSTSQFRIAEPGPTRTVPAEEAAQMPRVAPPPPPAAQPAPPPPQGAMPAREAGRSQPPMDAGPRAGRPDRDGMPRPQGQSWTTDGMPTVREENGVRYVTGGFGLDESTALRKAMSDYRVSFVLSRASGEYVAFVPIEITGMRGAPSLTVKAEGPYLLMDLPRGSYQAKATYEGRTLTRNFTVGAGGSQRIGFAW